MYVVVNDAANFCTVKQNLKKVQFREATKAEINVFLNIFKQNGSESTWQVKEKFQKTMKYLIM